MIEPFDPRMAMYLLEPDIPRGTTYIRFKSWLDSWEVILDKSDVILMFCPFGKMPKWHVLSDEELDNLIDALVKARKDKEKRK